MSEHTRLRMVCKSATKPRFNQQNVMMQAVHDEELAGEDDALSKGTPQATITMTVANENRMEFFERGKEYMVDFTPVEGAEDVEDEDETSEESPEETPEGDVDATPEAIELAKEKEIDLKGVKGTGEGGRILKGDVEAAVSEKGEGSE